MPAPSISVIIPAFNEASHLPTTLAHLAVATERLKDTAGAVVEIIVVDNNSTDQTAVIAHVSGATVVHEATHNIARVRNTGGRMARHDTLVFLDADTLVPPNLLVAITQVMADPRCMGGAVDATHRVRRLSVRAYLAFWRILGHLGGMAQGACQFCRASVFRDLGGYDETQFMGEDVDFYWRLRQVARTRGARTRFLSDVQVAPSPRRFDEWPLWRTLVWTNPLVVLAFRRQPEAWRGWYRNLRGERASEIRCTRRKSAA